MCASQRTVSTRAASSVSRSSALQGSSSSWHEPPHFARKAFLSRQRAADPHTCAHDTARQRPPTGHNGRGGRGLGSARSAARNRSEKVEISHQDQLLANGFAVRGVLRSKLRSQVDYGHLRGYPSAICITSAQSCRFPTRWRDPRVGLAPFLRVRLDFPRRGVRHR